MRDQPLPLLDKEGYLVDLNDWTPVVAEQLAAADSISLTQAHWQVIDLLRTFYAQTDTSPTMRALVKLVREKLGVPSIDCILMVARFRYFWGVSFATVRCRSLVYCTGA